ncbi:MAG: methyltransferase family protein [Candidatus Hodarchaeota archaeon]
MNVRRHEGHEREIPHAHFYHIILPIIFMVIWFLDSQIFQISTILNDFLPLMIRFSIFILIIIIAITFIMLSHRALFKNHQPPTKIITSGILGYSRNPMYFGIILIYLAFIFLSISLISIGIFIMIFLVYNRMVNFEENLLEKMFGKDYLDYKKRVRKWFPIPIKTND